MGAHCFWRDPHYNTLWCLENSNNSFLGWLKMKNDTSAAIFEEILSRIRPFGYFQKRLYFLTSLIQVFVTTVILYVDFVYLNVKNGKCALSSRIFLDNVTNISTPGETENPCGFNQWEVPTVNYDILWSFLSVGMLNYYIQGFTIVMLLCSFYKVATFLT